MDVRCYMYTNSLAKSAIMKQVSQCWVTDLLHEGAPCYLQSGAAAPETTLTKGVAESKTQVHGVMKQVCSKLCERQLV